MGPPTFLEGWIGNWGLGFSLTLKWLPRIWVQIGPLNGALNFAALFAQGESS
jgi:hypothetical protein